MQSLGLGKEVAFEENSERSSISQGPVRKTETMTTAPKRGAINTGHWFLKC